MITLHWNPKGNDNITLQDGLVESFVESVVTSYNNGLKPKSLSCDYNIGNELILNYFRVAIVEGRLHHKDLQLITENENGEKVLIVFDKDSQPDSLIGYPSNFDDSLNRILKW